MKARRARFSPARRLRPFWIVIVASLGAGATLVGFAVSWAGFDPRTIAVSGNRLVSRAEIVDRADISPRINMWLQDPRAIAHRIEAIPDVESVSVRRIPPTTIELSVIERKPFAVVSSGAGDVLVDRDLRVLSEPPPNDDLPVMRFQPRASVAPGTFLGEPRLVALREDYDALVSAHVIPRELRFDHFGGLIVSLAGGLSVLFGDDADLAKKAALVNPILAQVDRDRRRISTLDLRAPSTPVVVYK
ncbi:MAG: FtsQ-type POTRA domain-containing protein [Candidatus Eremiobacteraeota bacterium]|nr:FtsQ-type POTRA domain-containing protein [Candidatus Eremiobacteraeota bacterium]